MIAGCSSGTPDNPQAASLVAPDGKDLGSQTAGLEPIAQQTASWDLEDVSWDGDVGTHDCINPPGTCIVGSMGPPTDPQSDDAVIFITNTRGAADLAGNLTLTWSATSPLTQEIYVTVRTYSGCPDDCREEDVLDAVTGPSPLLIPLDALRLEDGRTLGFLFRPAPVDGGGAQAYVAAGQGIHLEGQVASRSA